MFPFLACPTSERDARVTDEIMSPGRLHRALLPNMTNGNGVKSTNAPPAPQNDIVPSTKTMYIHSTWIKGRVEGHFDAPQSNEVQEWWNRFNPTVILYPKQPTMEDITETHSAMRNMKKMVVKEARLIWKQFYIKAAAASPYTWLAKRSDGQTITTFDALLACLNELVPPDASTKRLGEVGMIRF